jgi:hypothetical protein
MIAYSFSDCPFIVVPSSYTVNATLLIFGRMIGHDM